MTSGSPANARAALRPASPPHRGGFGIPFDADQLSGEEERAAGLELQGIQQEPGRVDESVAMQAAVPEELRLF